VREGVGGKKTGCVKYRGMQCVRLDAAAPVCKIRIDERRACRGFREGRKRSRDVWWMWGMEMLRETSFQGSVSARWRMHVEQAGSWGVVGSEDRTRAEDVGRETA
jgi:hypothetical protein